MLDVLVFHSFISAERYSVVWIYHILFIHSSFEDL